MKFKNGSAIVDAIQWPGAWDLLEEDPEWVAEAIRDGRFFPTHDGTSIPGPIMLRTTEMGDRRIEVGYWIVRTVRGGLHRVLPRTFAATYKPLLH